MTKWPCLMITFALISMVQMNHSMAQKHISKDATLTATIPKDAEYESGRYHADVKNEYLTNNSITQFNNSKKSLPDNSLSIITSPNSFDARNGSAGNSYQYKQFIPDKHVIEKCSKNESFCVDVDNYPRHDILRILRTSKFMSSTFFGVDTINDLETRLDKDGLLPFCESREEIVFPTSSQNINDKWRYIVQDNDDNSIYKQGIKLDKCIQNCSCKFEEYMPQSYKTTCVQKFMYKKLVAVNENNNIDYDIFKLPYGCMCMTYNVNSQILIKKGGQSEDQTTG